MKIRGQITLPGDKSISHRVLMFGALTKEPCRIVNLSTSADVNATRLCLSACGMKTRKSGESLVTEGGNLHHPDHTLDCGNSGTTARLLTGLLTGRMINAALTGDDSLRKRPMNRIIHPLTAMGARISSENGNLPLSIAAAPLRGMTHRLPIASAQVKSAILFAGLGAEGETTVTEPVLSRDHTELMMKALGVQLKKQGTTTSVQPITQALPGFEMTVPGDPSSAAFFAAAALIIPGSELIINNMLLNPTRMGFFNAVERMGGNVETISIEDELSEPVGKMVIRAGNLRSISLGKEDIPAIIDELPVLAVLASQADGITTVRGAGELRVKESDRIHAICLNLKRMGAHVTEYDDGFHIKGPVRLKGADITAFGDHRIAMAFTIAGLIAEGTTTLDDPGCVSVSFPEFPLYLKEIFR